MADETLAVRAAEALPGWAGSIRFRLMVLYSVLISTEWRNVDDNQGTMGLRL